MAQTDAAASLLARPETVQPHKLRVLVAEDTLLGQSSYHRTKPAFPADLF